MFFNKNGLEIDLNFNHSLDEKEISELEKVKVNKNLIRKESAIYFTQTTKSIQLETKKEKPKLLRKSSYNFPIISKLKLNRDLIINKTSKFEILKSTKLILPIKHNFEIIKSNDINIIIPKKIIETEIKTEINEEKKEKSNIDIKLFQDLNCCNCNNIFIERKKKNYNFDIQNKINDIELLGKTTPKIFEIINISSKAVDIFIENIIRKKPDIKTDRTSNLEIIQNILPKNYSIDTNIISFHISGKFKSKELKEENTYSMQSNIINFEIINKSQKEFKNIFEERIINFDIKTTNKKKRKKSPNIIFKKVDGFGNVNNKLFTKEINNKEKILNQNGIEKDNIKKKKNDKKNEIDSKLDKFKIKSPNNVKIKINNNNPEINNIKENISSKRQINKIISSHKENKNSLTINTINNEMNLNKQSLDFPIISNDILHIEEQYEKIKKDLIDLYPIFNKNKKYRENFFMQLSQGNQDKYNFYLGLYKIIRDEQEEKNNNNFENYLKIKKIIGNYNNGIKCNSKNKLKPLKKNKSSHYIFAKDKIKPLYTDL